MLYMDQNGRRSWVSPETSARETIPAEHEYYETNNYCQRPIPGPQQACRSQTTGAGQERLGIYIKSVVKGGAADADGRLQAGDQLLKVDGQSLVGITQEKAAEYLVRTGPVVSLEVAKQGAIYHGLATLLSQPSPVMSRVPRPHSDVYPRDGASFSHLTPGVNTLGAAASRYPPRNVLAPQQPPAHHYEWAQPITITGPRRMSERDLPNRVLTEQNPVNARRTLPPSNMQSSKSVPALNSDSGRDLVHQVPAAGGMKPNEAFGPGYSRTSSTNSIPQKAYEQSPSNAGVRSRSSHNLHDGVHGMPPLPPQAGVTRQASTPSLPAQQHQSPAQQAESERFYQNLSVYRNTGGHSNSPIMQNGYPNSPGSPSRGKMPSPHDDRLMGQQVPQQQQKMIPRGPQSSIPRGADPLRDRPASAYLPQKEGYGPQQPHGPVTGSLPVPRSQSARDVMRQEAKLHEMQEEVRRREARSAVPPPGNGHYSPGSQHPVVMQHSRSHPQLPPPQGGPHIRPSNSFPSPSAYSSEPMHQGPAHPHHQQMGYPSPTRHTAVPGPPPTAPKPRGRGPYDGIDTPPGRPPPPDDMYRESPPPPPPTSTHPLYQPSKSSPAGDNRYTASMGEPPRGAYVPTRPPHSQQQHGATNPWDREEREKEQLRRREAARQWRDQQIAELEAQVRSPQQEEQLRALHLEREFQRRAEEAAHLGDEDDEENEETNHDDAKGGHPQGLLMRSTEEVTRHMQRTRLVQSPSTETAGPQQMSSADSQQRVPEQYGRPMDEHERQRKLEEMRRKQMELEAAREAEEKILREAQRKREDDLRQQREQQLREQQFHLQQQQSFHSQQPASPAYHTQPSNNSPPQRPAPTNHLHQQYKPSPTSPLSLSTAHYNGHLPTNGPYSPQDESIGTPTGSQRLDSLLNSNGAPASPTSVPPPPERGSSFAVMSTQQPGGVLRNSNSTARSSEQPPKRVSFHDPKTSPPEPSNHMDRPREDPNNFINEAQTLLSTPRSPDSPFSSNTPGVIGAQEVYKDPRMRRLAEQQHQKLLANRVGPGPEKLSFKEKMKMFAMETGENGTPKDKVKISRAQRDIEGVPPNINNNSLSEDKNY